MANIYENIPRTTDNYIVVEDLTHPAARQAISISETSLKKHGSIRRFLQKPHVRLTIYAVCVIAIMVISIAVCTSVALQMTAEGSGLSKNSTTEIFPRESRKEDPLPSIPSYRMFTKAEWGGKPSSNFISLHHPTDYVVVSHTEGKSCTNFEDCASVLQQIQSNHISRLKTVDIGYNFLIGGDGNVYIGRGWDIRNFYKNNNIGISFIGNYVSNELTPNMISALEGLLALGVKLGKLPADYKLVCYNQFSLNDNICKEISMLSNFYAKPVDF